MPGGSGPGRAARPRRFSGHLCRGWFPTVGTAGETPTSPRGRYVALPHAGVLLSPHPDGWGGQGFGTSVGTGLSSPSGHEIPQFRALASQRADFVHSCRGNSSDQHTGPLPAAASQPPRAVSGCRRVLGVQGRGQRRAADRSGPGGQALWCALVSETIPTCLGLRPAL